MVGVGGPPILTQSQHGPGRIPGPVGWLPRKLRRQEHGLIPGYATSGFDSKWQARADARAG